jgi:hypothetical protein
MAFDADPAFAASPSSRSVSPLSGFNPGEGRSTVASILGELDAYEAWRPALAAYYKARCMWMSSELLATGIPLTVCDRGEINALRKAFEVAPR